MQDPEGFLKMVADYTEKAGRDKSQNKPIRLGMIDPDYDQTQFLGNVLPRVLFDGESTISQKRYAVMPPYYPKPADRVALVPIGTTYLIIGAVANVPITPQVEYFTTSGTWTKPAGCRYVKVQVQAGGGAGAGAAATTAGNGSVGAGGAGGGYGESYLAAGNLNDTVEVTAGPGGAGVSGANGGSGGMSAFGAHVTATGGSGGASIGAGSTVSAQSGADSDTQVIVADLIIKGSGGGAAYRASATAAIGGDGGASHLGGGGRNIGTGGGIAGAPGLAYGGAGSGAVNVGAQSARAGGDGAQGIVIVTSYFF